jgi:ribonuclease HI
MNMTTVYTDGGAAPSNPGPGGYAAVLASGEEYFGYVPHATNNVCEILGLILALEKVKLWTRLDVLLHGRHVTFEKVDRNGGCPGNERADELCGVARALRRGSS